MTGGKPTNSVATNVSLVTLLSCTGDSTGLTVLNWKDIKAKHLHMDLKVIFLPLRRRRNDAGPCGRGRKEGCKRIEQRRDGSLQSAGQPCQLGQTLTVPCFHSFIQPPPSLRFLVIRNSTCWVSSNWWHCHTLFL